MTDKMDSPDNEAPAPDPSGAGAGDTPAPPSPPTAGDEPTGNDDAGAELKAFMEEYRADKKAAAEAAEAKVQADAEAEAKKKKVPAPEPKKKPKAKVEEPPAAEVPKERSYGSARYFNRKPKRVKE